MVMPSRGPAFHQGIQDAVAARERLVLVVGPKAAVSDCGDGGRETRAEREDYVRQELQFALQADKAVTPILRQGDYLLVPDELKLLHCEDFRDAAQHAFHVQNLVRQFREPVPSLGKLIAVPSLPAHYLARAKRLKTLPDAIRADLDRPVVITGAAARVGVHGMGGIGKSVLAKALVRDRKVREAFPDGIVTVIQYEVMVQLGERHKCQAGKSDFNGRNDHADDHAGRGPESPGRNHREVDAGRGGRPDPR